MAINKVVYGTTTLVDLTGTTATSDKILTGYGAYGKDGVWMDGSATSGGIESVTQDQNGYVVLDDDEGNQIVVDPLSVTSNGTYTANTGHAYSPVTVNVSGGSTTEVGRVNFYDYDGTLAYSYTDTEFLALSSMPSNPTHTGLISQGWNWTLSDAKTHVTEYKYLDIGQHYITENGNTEIDLNIDEDAITIMLCLSTSATRHSFIINWGDGTSENITGLYEYKIEHTYSTLGTYTISISAATETSYYYLGSGSAYYSVITRPNSISTTNNQNMGIPYSKYVVSARIGNNVTQISQWCFSKCMNLQYVTIPNDIVFNIGGYIFYQCNSLKQITVPSSNTTIANNIFENCYSIKSIAIPNTITNIGNSSFNKCHELKALTMSNSITSIGTSAICNCHNLETLILSKNIIGSLNSVFGQNYKIKHISIPNGITDITYLYFTNNYLLESVTFPSNITSISYSSNPFTRCYSLKSVVLPNTTTEVKDYMFQYCHNLTSITIPSSVTSIGTSAFNYCSSLESIVIPNNVTVIKSMAFSFCTSLTSITIPNGVTSIGDTAFSNCYALTSVTIPSSVTSIGTSAFASCYGLTSVTIHNGVTSIGNSAFNSCHSLTSVTIPSSVTSIGNSVFSSCYVLTSVTIPNGVTSIGNYSFQYCYGLKSITIPSSVTSIGTSAFNYCSSLETVHMISDTPPTLDSNTVFSSTATLVAIYVPVGSLTAYQEATNWSIYASKIQEEPS